MPIKKRKVKLRKKPAPLTTEAALARMGDILAAGHGTEADARTYYELLYRDQLARLQSIAARADKERNWEFMHGCYKQAAELYVLASVVYEKAPEHMLLSDGAYDYLGRFLLANYDKADKEFWDWYTISAVDLKAGTGMNVTAQTPIRWMFHLLTGEALPDDEAPHKRPRVLRGPTKRRGEPTSRGAGRPRRRIKRTGGTGTEPDQGDEAGKASGRTGGTSRPSRGKPKEGAVRPPEKPRTNARPRRRPNRK